MEGRTKEFSWNTELDQNPTIVIRVWRDQVQEILEFVHGLAAQNKLEVSTAAVQGSWEVVVTFFVAVIGDPTVRAAIGGVIGRIATFLVERRLGRVRGKNQAAALEQVRGALVSEGAYIERVDSARILPGWGFQFIVRDNQNTRHIFDVGNKCDLLRDRLE